MLHFQELGGIGISESSTILKKIERGGPQNPPICTSLYTSFFLDNFAGNKKFPYRVGGGRDVGNLQTCFKDLGFHHADDDCKTNLKAHQMWDWFHTWAVERDYTEVDCVVIAILTHGLSGDLLLGVDGKHVALDSLLSFFDGDRCCPTLAGKPKIFIIEACRGEEIDKGIEDPSATAPGNKTLGLLR